MQVPKEDAPGIPPELMASLNISAEVDYWAHVNPLVKMVALSGASANSFCSLGAVLACC